MSIKVPTLRVDCLCRMLMADVSLQFELERLNGASEEINRLELELDVRIPIF